MNQFILTYVGTITDKYNIDALFEAVRIINAPDMLIRFVGTASAGIKEKAKGMNVEFI